MKKKKKTTTKKISYEDIIGFFEEHKISAIFTVPGHKDGGRGSHFESLSDRLALLDYIKLMEKRDDVIRSLEAAKWVAESIDDDSILGKALRDKEEDKPNYIG